ncbi:E3 ubiquitin-protein ligase UPL6 [Sesamum angolense]|uniref:HECT-type E3 ubiquitin transferase n=1 Tax=Sesamum angolense TaxID=2727404 RepID=A0AAE2C1C1_9LAMI|nr:E3 ubiquitin-protein ligase UPL6 [Sesamum angolense]
MFFTGDPSTRKRVDLGGRSSKERDRQKLLEQTRLERNRRLWLRQQNAAALKIQKCFRGRRVVEAERSKVREKFFLTYGQYCQDVNRQCFGPDSDFLYQLLFFFNPRYVADFSALVETCRLLLEFVHDNGDVVSLFAGMDYSSKRGLVEYRIKNLAYACVRAIYENRNQLKDQLFLAPEKSNRSANVLLEAVILLIDLKLPWACNTVCYLSQRNMYSMFREIILMGKCFPSYACLLGNLLEVAGVAITQPGSFAWAMDFATVATFLLQALPPLQTSNQGDSTMGEDEMLTNVLLGGILPNVGSHKGKPDDDEVAAVGAACSFLHVTFNILPLERIMTVLAYRTELVPILWNFMKRCHENDTWSSLSGQSAHLPVDTPGWLLPLSVFCPVYKHMLMIVDNEEFYEQEKPLSLVDIRLLIVILRQALWQILWLNPVATPNFSKSADGPSAMRRRPIEFLQHRVCVVASELMSQLQDWNNRREFTSPNDFNADGASDLFMSQIRITFVNEFGVEEAGIDGGGIFKDFMENITRAAFDVQYGLFKETADHLLYPNPGSGLIHEQHLQFFHFLGLFLQRILVDSICNILLEQIEAKHYGGDISELELYFVIVNNEYGEQTEEELLPGGKNIRDHYVIEMFWEVIQNLSLENKRKFLKFATGCSRGPLLGFKYLEPTFCIQRTAGNASEEALDRLPTSATCMNLLKLPPYRSKQQMEQKLLYAINSDAGFDLS